MDRRQVLTGAAVAAVAVAAPALADKTACLGLSPELLQAAGTLWLLSQGDLHQCLAALLSVSDDACIR